MSSPVDSASQALADLSDSYLADGRPWVVAYSGGKDSTLVLQLVYETLIALGDKATKPVYVISSDTGVEGVEHQPLAVDADDAPIPGEPLAEGAADLRSAPSRLGAQARER